MKYWVLLILLMSACGSRTGRPSYFIDPTLKPFFDSFHYDMYAANLVPIGHVQRLEFGVTPTGTVGICTYTTQTDKYFDGTSEETDNWGTIKIVTDLDPVILKVIVYHEMAHCEYRVDHAVDDSIMSPNPPNWPTYWTRDWKGHLNTLIRFIRSHKGENRQ